MQIRRIHWVEVDLLPDLAHKVVQLQSFKTDFLSCTIKK
jgi:hypothetical protein